MHPHTLARIYCTMTSYHPRDECCSARMMQAITRDGGDKLCSHNQTPKEMPHARSNACTAAKCSITVFLIHQTHIHAYTQTSPPPIQQPNPSITHTQRFPWQLPTAQRSDRPHGVTHLQGLQRGLLASQQLPPTSANELAEVVVERMLLLHLASLLLPAHARHTASSCRITIASAHRCCGHGETQEQQLAQ